MVQQYRKMNPQQMASVNRYHLGVEVVWKFDSCAEDVSASVYYKYLDFLNRNRWVLR